MITSKSASLFRLNRRAAYWKCGAQNASRKKTDDGSKRRIGIAALQEIRQRRTTRIAAGKKTTRLIRTRAIRPQCPACQPPIGLICCRIQAG
jgi:hypothetical protein